MKVSLFLNHRSLRRENKPGQDVVQLWQLRQRQILPFQVNYKVHWEFHGDVQCTAEASADSRGEGDLGTATFRDLAACTASKEGRWDSTRLWRDL